MNKISHLCTYETIEVEYKNSIFQFSDFKKELNIFSYRKKIKI